MFIKNEKKNQKKEKLPMNFIYETFLIQKPKLLPSIKFPSHCRIHVEAGPRARIADKSEFPVGYEFNLISVNRYFVARDVLDEKTSDEVFEQLRKVYLSKLEEVRNRPEYKEKKRKQEQIDRQRRQEEQRRIQQQNRLREEERRRKQEQEERLKRENQEKRLRELAQIQKKQEEDQQKRGEVQQNKHQSKLPQSNQPQISKHQDKPAQNNPASNEPSQSNASENNQTPRINPFLSKNSQNNVPPKRIDLRSIFGNASTQHDNHPAQNNPSVSNNSLDHNFDTKLDNKNDAELSSRNMNQSQDSLSGNGVFQPNRRTNIFERQKSNIGQANQQSRQYGSNFRQDNQQNHNSNIFGNSQNNQPRDNNLFTNQANNNQSKNNIFPSNNVFTTNSNNNNFRFSNYNQTQQQQFRSANMFGGNQQQNNLSNQPGYNQVGSFFRGMAGNMSQGSLFSLSDNNQGYNGNQLSSKYNKKPKKNNVDRIR